jgi:hypothetical protein
MPREGTAMILLDADVQLLDIRYPADVKFAMNRKALERIHTEQLPTGITSQALLETVGILSFNLSPQTVPRLAHQLCLQYRLSVIPDLEKHPAYAGCTVQDLVEQMTSRMALGDAVQAVQIAQYGAALECLLTWNVKHFTGKLAVPAYTPEYWLSLRTGKD